MEATSTLLDIYNYVDWSARVKSKLMAQDLWSVIESTTEHPNEEDDKDAFTIWEAKNFMALQVIWDSCGWKAFSHINEISLAKRAWSALEAKYNLNKDNYEDWRNWVKTNLEAQDLWSIVETTSEPAKQEHDEAAFIDWSSRNFKALQVIWKSCGCNAFSEIKGISSAQIAWNELSKKYGMQNGNGKSVWAKHTALVKAVRRGDWGATKVFLENHPDALTAKITSQGERILHIAVDAGHEHVVDELVKLTKEEDLEMEDDDGWTALHNTTIAGNRQMAEFLLRKNQNLLSHVEPIPLARAIVNGHRDFVSYLYPQTPPQVLRQNNGSGGATVCTAAIYNWMFDIALDLISRDASFALALDEDGKSPLSALAGMPGAFRSGNRLGFWKGWIYSCIPIKSTDDTNQTRLSIEDVECHKSDQVQIIRSVIARFHQAVSILRKFLGIEHLYEMKMVHVQTEGLLCLICRQISKSNDDPSDNAEIISALHRAVEEGIFELVFKVVKESPDLIWESDEEDRDLFSIAVLHRQAQIFSLIYRLPLKNKLITTGDKSGNNILHMAGLSAPSARLNRIAGAALQMQSELQWFKEVDSIVLPSVREARNNYKLTPRELFTKEHKELMEKAERWMKDTATSCSVAAALIITIMFAVAFTVPGGNDQTGRPIFLHEKLFTLFMVSDSLSLFSSSTSLLMFMGILTSRYAEEDFRISLPTKMIIGLFTLFLSIAAMMTTFCAATLLMLGRESWTAIPVICLASIPITLFGLNQFPLLLAMFKSTFGSGVFDRKMKCWF